MMKAEDFGNDIIKAINILSDHIHANAVKKGFWQDNQINFGDLGGIPTRLMLIVSEVSEAMEADRNGDKENLAEELADIIIRTLDLSYSLNINIGKTIIDKHLINMKRSYKHGKRY